MTSLAVSPDGHWARGRAAGTRPASPSGTCTGAGSSASSDREMPPASPNSSSASAPTAGGSFRAPFRMPARPRYHFWRVGTWELERRIETDQIAEHAPFTSDGRLMALQHRPPDHARRRRHRPRAGAAVDRAAGRPDAAGVQPRRHETGGQHRPEHCTRVGPAAGPRPARADGPGLGRAAVLSRPKRAKPRPAAASCCTSRGRGAREPGAARR